MRTTKSAHQVRNLLKGALLLWSGLFFGDFAQAQCTSPTAPSGALQWISASSKVMYCKGTTWQATADSATATGCSPSGKIEYRSGAVQFCNGSVWVNTATATNYAACAAGSAGYFYYSTSDTYYWYCNGTKWKRMSP